MPVRSNRKSNSRRGRSKAHQPALKGILVVLVVIISLSIIAFTATHIYVRMNKPAKTIIPLEQSVNQPADTIVSEAQPESEAQKPEGTGKLVHEPRLMGTWVSNSSSSMTTFDGSGYTLEMPTVEESQLIKGSFSIIDGVIILKTTEGPKPCSNSTGRYTYTLKGDDLTLRLQSDGCKLRSTQLNASFFRLY